MIAIWSWVVRQATFIDQASDDNFRRGIASILAIGKFVFINAILHHLYPASPRAVILTLISLYLGIVYGFFLDWLFQQPFPHRRRAPVGYPCATPSDLPDLTHAGRRRRS